MPEMRRYVCRHLCKYLRCVMCVNVIAMCDVRVTCGMFTKGMSFAKKKKKSKNLHIHASIISIESAYAEDDSVSQTYK